jgi:hypothetical protein
MIPWLLKLATRTLACALNMPEPLLQNTGVFVFAHVQAVETSVGSRPCAASRRVDPHRPLNPEKGELP